MSEFLAEAQVLIVPNTATFAASLKAQLAKAVAEVGPVVIPVTAAPLAAGAAAEVAAQTKVATAAVVENTVALDAQGAATLKASAAQTNLARAEKLQAEAEALLSGAVQVASLKTTELARARSILASTSHAAAISERAVALAIASGNVEIQTSTAALLTNARAEQVNATAAVKNAIAHQAEAAATAESAAAHSQAARGIAAETLALGGLRGATLAASAPFLLGATAAIVFAKSIKEASDETEELNKTAVVFGDSAKTIEEFSKTTATSLGISSTEALRAAGVFGNLFRTIHIATPIAADMSTRLVSLASDLASFNNADPSRTLDALRSGLVGQARPLRVFGIFLSAARVQQQALIDTQKKSVKQLTQSELVQARFNLILKDSVLAQGDFARTSGRLANQSRVLKAELSDVGVQIGRVLIPALTAAITDVNLLFVAFKRLEGVKISIPGTEKGGSLDLLQGKLKAIFGDRPVKNFELNLLIPGVGSTLTTLQLLDKGIKLLAGDTDEATSAFDRIGLHASAALNALAAALQKAAGGRIPDITHQLAALEVEALKIQTGLSPGGRGAEEANVRKQIEDDKKAVAQSKSGTKARKDAILQLKSDQDDLARLLAQDASDAQDRANRIKDAAAKQKDAAAKAAQAQADATQAFIDQFSGRQERLQNRLTSAQLFGNAAQQIALNKKIVAADKAEISAIKARIAHLHLHGDALKLAKATIAALNQEIFNTRNAILQLQSERKQALISARQSHLEAVLAIAETTTSTKDDTAAEKALIKFDQAQIRRILAIKRRRRLTLDEAAQLDAYRVDLAQRNQALKDLKGEVIDAGKKFNELTFQFLQTQQGFAANLLGNLIPGGATGGLVGGPTQEMASAAFTPATSVQKEAAVAGSRDRGVRPVQVDTTNHLLRSILRALQSLNGRAGHPEARYQKATGGSAMDVM